MGSESRSTAASAARTLFARVTSRLKESKRTLECFDDFDIYGAQVSLRSRLRGVVEPTVQPLLL